MNESWVLEVLQKLPEYIRYIYPGYLTIYLYFFFRGKTLRDSNYILIKSIAISYLYIVLADVMGAAASEALLNGVLVCLSVIVAYLGYRLVWSGALHKLLEILKVPTTFYSNEIEALATIDKGAWLVVYLKDDDVVYEGSLGYKDLDEGERKYICLDQFYKYRLDEDGRPREPYIEDHAGDSKEIVMIFYDSVKRIEKRSL